MAGIYIHIPFCKSRCYYCDFFSGTSLTRRNELLEMLHYELRMRLGRHDCSPSKTDSQIDFSQRGVLQTAAPFSCSSCNDSSELERQPNSSLISLPATACIETLYFGGGTPSLLSPGELGDFIRQIRQQWHNAPLEEITVEANPDDLSLDYLTALRQEGVNRLSIGIQSFHDRDLQWMHRRHTARSAIEAVQAARQAGFDNLSIDLIYGLPHMTLEEWRDNLQQALSLRPEHLSAYHLTIEPQTPFGRAKARGTLQEIDSESSLAQYKLLRSILCEAGYEHYEISNFALPGRRARHNSLYWHDVPYLGIGPSAHSFNGKRRQWNIAHLGRYLERTPTAAQAESEILTPEMQYDEHIMTHLRTADGVHTAELASRFGPERLRYFIRQAERHLVSGDLILVTEHCGNHASPVKTKIATNPDSILQQTSDSSQPHIDQPEEAPDLCYRIPAERWFVSDSIISDLFVG